MPGLSLRPTFGIARGLLAKNPFTPSSRHGAAYNAPCANHRRSPQALNRTGLRPLLYAASMLPEALTCVDPARHLVEQLGASPVRRG